MYVFQGLRDASQEGVNWTHRECVLDLEPTSIRRVCLLRRVTTAGQNAVLVLRHAMHNNMRDSTEAQDRDSDILYLNAVIQIILFSWL